MNHDPNIISTLEALLFSGFASIGGFLAYMLRTLNKEEKPSIFRGLIEAAASGFVGLIAMFACKAMGFDWLWSGVVVGVFGWLGAEASIALLTNVVRQRLGIDKNDCETKDDTDKGKN